jgi:restriction system protein
MHDFLIAISNAPSMQTRQWIAASLVVLGISLWMWVGKPNRKAQRHDRTAQRHKRKQKQARQVFDKLATIEHPAQKLTYLRAICPLVFEELVLEAFERRGHQVFRSASYSGDGGIDGRLIINDVSYLVQCKRYGKHISKQHVLDFAAILERDSSMGLFCHTGRTGAFSREFHKQHPYLKIVSGDRLLKLLTLPSPASPPPLRRAQ